ncbi:MAG: hypothetical protein ACREF5_01325 [Candidatus Saccharimonadales bacterium]
MADSLFDILSQKDFTEPPETMAIKRYIQDHFKVAVEAVIHNSDIIISAPSAALANTLRYHSRELKFAAKTDKRIVLRIK